MCSPHRRQLWCCCSMTYIGAPQSRHAMGTVTNTCCVANVSDVCWWLCSITQRSTPLWTRRNTQAAQQRAPGSAPSEGAALHAAEASSEHSMPRTANSHVCHSVRACTWGIGTNFDNSLGWGTTTLYLSWAGPPIIITLNPNPKYPFEVDGSLRNTPSHTKCDS